MKLSRYLIVQIHILVARAEGRELKVKTILQEIAREVLNKSSDLHIQA